MSIRRMEILGSVSSDGTLYVSVRTDALQNMTEHANNLAEENARLKKKLGWKKIKSVEQLEKLEPGTYGFLDAGGDNYYGVKVDKNGTGKCFFLTYIHEDSDAYAFYADCENAFEKFTQYRKMHSWYPVSKKKSDEELRQELYDLIKSRPDIQSAKLSRDGDFAILSVEHVSTLEHLAELFGIDLEKK